MVNENTPESVAQRWLCILGTFIVDLIQRNEPLKNSPPSDEIEASQYKPQKRRRIRFSNPHICTLHGEARWFSRPRASAIDNKSNCRWCTDWMQDLSALSDFSRSPHECNPLYELVEWVAWFWSNQRVPGGHSVPLEHKMWQKEFVFVRGF